MKIRLFWRLGLIYLLLLVFGFAAIDTYVVQSLRREYLRGAFAELSSIAALARGDPINVQDAWALRSRVSWIARSGIRVTVIASDGRVLADSDEDASSLANHSGWPEVRQALQSGEGRAVRHSESVGKELAYLAVTMQSGDRIPLILRLATPMYPLDQELTTFRWRLWTVSLGVMIIAGGVSLAFFRSLSGRIDRLKQFSDRVARGSFTPFPVDHKQDELGEFSRTFSETAAKLEKTIRSLTEERNQSGAILRSMAEGVVVIGSDQRVTFCNAAFCRAMAINASGWEGRPMVEVIRQSDLLEAVQEALAGNEVVRGELVIGAVRTRSFALTAAPVKSDGTVGAAVMVLHDISELRRLERARRDFVANISHEFKTPLTAIQGFSETLLAGALQDEQNSRRFLEIIRDNSERLGRLTEDLLQLAQIEAGKLVLESQTVPVAQLIEPCIETTHLKADVKQLSIEAEYAADLPEIAGDLRYLKQAIQNILDNAVRYTLPKGHIKLSAGLSGAQILIVVSDDGIGIPKAEQERIFERFYRTDAARSRELGGTGLGLSIAKHLVEAHGGHIEVQSEVMHGSTFRVYLPCAV